MSYMPTKTETNPEFLNSMESSNRVEFTFHQTPIINQPIYNRNSSQIHRDHNDQSNKLALDHEKYFDQHEYQSNFDNFEYQMETNTFPFVPQFEMTRTASDTTIHHFLYNSHDGPSTTRNNSNGE